MYDFIRTSIGFRTYLAEAVVALGYQDDDVVVNVQGDEPLIPPGIINQVAQNLIEHDNIKVATLCEPIKN